MNEACRHRLSIWREYLQWCIRIDVPLERCAEFNGITPMPSDWAARRLLRTNSYIAQIDSGETPNQKGIETELAEARILLDGLMV